MRDLDFTTVTIHEVQRGANLQFDRDQRNQARRLRVRIKDAQKQIDEHLRHHAGTLALEKRFARRDGVKLTRFIFQPDFAHPTPYVPKPGMVCLPLHFNYEQCLAELRRPAHAANLHSGWSLRNGSSGRNIGLCTER